MQQANGTAEGHAGSRQIEAVRFAAADGGPRREFIAEEVPVALVYNRFPFAVMLATPADLEDFAVGFSLTEAVVGDAAEISDVRTREEESGVEVHIEITKDRYMRLRERHRRNLVAGSSCGLCGSDSFAEALRPLDPLLSMRRFAPQAISRAMAELPAHQILNRGLGSLHAAAFATPDGAIVAAREDVGRHNALDKLVGFLARNGIDREAGFVAVSSRCSFEMVHKTAAAGVPLIASISAPTSLAVSFAEETGIGLAAFARDGRFSLYATASRIAE
ncbi:formate dehydrogenase accessory sulfurtransferase FdhD [Telmatospirillum siberiense]|uniref:Sulfur carrier protein FdhD n=1 Tax=Telmatospirillum siberiense TaxID=382514 RepID=A0A2N3PPP6_9PROT|nr:formate dehydrogenase accessory sulfurtransferase FdhD [Telmatospirillum siberiense]PKU22357.1 sulfurtransferase FdhD [Telmatospirillum siberiense]